MTEAASVAARIAPQDLVIGLTRVLGATAACAEHGDVAAVAVLETHHAQVASFVEQAGGRVVKFLGDGSLVVFPPSRVGEALASLERLRVEGSALWSEYDARCRVQIKVGRGVVMAGRFGIGPEGRFDVYGSALNQLFKAPWQDFLVTEDVRSIDGGDGA